MSKTYVISFGAAALPGVQAIGTLRRGQSIEVPAAEAVRLVDTKGLSFASAADERAARAELAASSSPDPAPIASPPAASDTPIASEEH